MAPKLSIDRPRPDQASAKGRIQPAIPLTFSRDRKPRRPASETEPTPVATAENGAVPVQSPPRHEDTAANQQLTQDSIPSQASKPTSSIRTPAEQSADDTRGHSPAAEAGTSPGPASHSVEEQHSPQMHPARPHLQDGHHGHGRQSPSRNPPIKIPHEPTPTFYPHNSQPTPASATSTTHPAPMASQHPPFIHQPRPSVNGLVFGGFTDSSSPSPAQSTFPNGVGYPAPVVTMQPVPPFVPAGHAHSSSNPANIPLGNFPPSGMPPPTFVYGEPLPHTTGPPNWLNPEANIFPHVVAQPDFVNEQRLVDGEALSRQMSQGSSGPRDLSSPLSLDGSRQGSDDGRYQLNGAGVPYQHRMPRPSAATANHRQHPSYGHSFLGHPQKHDPLLDGSALSLQHWIQSQYGKQDFADHNLELSHAEQVIFSLPVHGVVVARSPTLMAAISGQATNAGRDKTTLPKLRLEVKDRFFLAHALGNALEYLYGVPLPNFHALAQSLSPIYPSDESSDFALSAMEHALGLLSAGLFLQLDAVAIHGLNFAKRFLRWDTLEKALAFSLDGGLTLPWLMRESNARRGSIDFSSNKPTYGELSGRLLDEVVNFLGCNFPHDFNFVSMSPQLADSPRLPITVDSRPSISGARLSRIQFGEIPIERPSFVDSILSSILVSLPFVVLKAVFEHGALVNRLPADQIAATMRSVVEERENRRLKVLRSKRVSPSIDPILWEATKWEERVEDDAQSRVSITLTRERKSVTEDNQGKDS